MSMSEDPYPLKLARRGNCKSTATNEGAHQGVRVEQRMGLVGLAGGEEGSRVRLSFPVPPLPAAGCQALSSPFPPG